VIYGMVPFTATLSELAKYSLTKSTRSLCATAELLVSRRPLHEVEFVVACVSLFVSNIAGRRLRRCHRETLRIGLDGQCVVFE